MTGVDVDARERRALPPEQEEAVRRAIRLAWATIAFLVTAVLALSLAMGSSQAMRSAWVEDLLSFIPPIAFLVAVRVTRRLPTAEHPFGYHRAVGVGHLVAATALTTMGALLVYEALSALAAQQHPPVGTVVVLGHPVWSGWVMIAALAYTAVPPVLLGRAKMPLAAALHDRVLYADADMNRADWLTAVGAIVGVLGIGAGLWWADAVAALFISGSILHDGVGNLRSAVRALMDARAQTVDGTDPHPVVGQVDRVLRELPWARAGRARVRDEGHVFHVEAFVVPRRMPSLDELEAARRAVQDLHWTVSEDVVVVLARELPERVLPGPDGGDEERSEGHDPG